MSRCVAFQGLCFFLISLYLWILLVFFLVFIDVCVENLSACLSIFFLDSACFLSFFQCAVPSLCTHQGKGQVQCVLVAVHVYVIHQILSRVLLHHPDVPAIFFAQINMNLAHSSVLIQFFVLLLVVDVLLLSHLRILYQQGW